MSLSEIQKEYQDTRLKLREGRMQAYLAALAATGTVRKACNAAQVSRGAITEWRNHPTEGEKFRLREDDALAEFKESLLDEAVTRGRDGWHEPVIYHGEMCYVRDPNTGELILGDDFNPIPLTVLKKSDAVLLKLLEAAVPGFQRGGVVLNMAAGGPGSGGMPAKITIEFVDAQDGAPVVPDVLSTPAPRAPLPAASAAAPNTIEGAKDVDWTEV